MKKSFQIFFFFLFVFVHGSTLQAQIQRTYHWYFGGGAGIVFSSGQAVADTNGQVNTWDGCTTISDTDGSLLFYTDGSTVWNKNHLIMQNGTGLMGHWSSHQNSVIVPKPLNSRIYYIFTTDAQENNFQNGLRYSIVDMSLNNGLGAVISKNILLVAPTHEQLAATFHSNCEDIWVITHKRNEEKFYAFLVTANGVSSTPVITEIGNAVELLWGCFGFKISPNGKKIVSGNFWDWVNTGVLDTVELYNFNTSTGILSDRIALTADTGNLIFSFSPDNNKLYVSGGNYIYSLYQFDLTANNINSSKQIVTPLNPYIYTYDAQFSPTDNKIYLTRANTDSLAIIHNPNASGAAANFEDVAFSLNGKQCMSSFPNFISSYFDTDSTGCFFSSVQDNLLKISNISVYPNPVLNSKQITIKIKNKMINKINFFTITGKEVITKTAYMQNEITLDLQDIPSGIYILKLTTENKTETKKIVIQNE